jgi:hypothetical protein
VSQLFTVYTIDGRVDKRGIRKDSEGSGRGLIEVLTQHFPRLAEKTHGSIVCVPWPPTEHKSRALPLHKPAVPIQLEHTGSRFTRNVDKILSQAVTSQTRVTFIMVA